MRETFDFAARVQGTGHKKAELEQLMAKEKEAGVEPDHELDAFIQVQLSILELAAPASAIHRSIMFCKLFLEPSQLGSRLAVRRCLTCLVPGHYILML